MKKLIFLFFTCLGLSAYSQENIISLQGGVAIPQSIDMKDVSKTIGYCSGIDYSRYLYGGKKTKVNLLVDLKTSIFQIVDAISSNGYTMFVYGGHTYREFSAGIGLSSIQEIGNRGLFLGVHLELAGFYNREPNIGYTTFVHDENGNPLELKGRMTADDGVSIGYNLGFDFYKMLSKNFGIGVQYDIFSTVRNNTSYVYITQPETYYTQSINDFKEKIVYMCGQLRCIYSF
ncbi:MAG: hypothetical protein J6X18_03805 [Bacteroidales bacterium]|nr:hypothetical protein [Bacteroidales bacterium]